jgi:hypothetical protein
MCVGCTRCLSCKIVNFHGAPLLGDSDHSSSWGIHSTQRSVDDACQYKSTGVQNVAELLLYNMMVGYGFRHASETGPQPGTTPPPPPPPLRLDTFDERLVSGRVNAERFDGHQE